jgi:hypothetical protein
LRELAKSSVQPTAITAICTLFEGDYHLGLAAFVNSLIRAGFSGSVWAGYRGTLPPWLDQLKHLGDQGHEYTVADQVRLIFLPLETDLHLTNYKPQFMLHLLANQARDCEYLWYFDPDIFLRCNWSFFADWQRYGIALCQEIATNILPENSPRRKKWIEIAASIGLFKPRPLNHYFNGEMVGVSAAQADFLLLWKRLIEHAEALGCDLRVFKPGTPDMPFSSSDQDALNVAAMFTELPLTTMGPEAMGFIHGGFTMFHAVGPKPWRGSLLRRALSGYPPSGGAKFFFTQVSSPIRVYSPIHLRAKQIACAAAAFIGRFYCRR